MIKTVITAAMIVLTGLAAQAHDDRLDAIVLNSVGSDGYKLEDILNWAVEQILDMQKTLEEQDAEIKRLTTALEKAVTTTLNIEFGEWGPRTVHDLEDADWNYASRLSSLKEDFNASKIDLLLNRLNLTNEVPPDVYWYTWENPAYYFYKEDEDTENVQYCPPVPRSDGGLFTCYDADHFADYLEDWKFWNQ